LGMCNLASSACKSISGVRESILTVRK
jgi:hypothetical protein